MAITETLSSTVICTDSAASAQITSPFQVKLLDGLPVLSDFSVATGETIAQADFAFLTDLPGEGQWAWVRTGSSTAPTAAQIVAGTDHLDATATESGGGAVPAGDTLTGALDGLTEGVAVNVHAVPYLNPPECRVYGGVVSASFVPDATAPTLSLPTDDADGSDAATGTVETDEAGGALYFGAWATGSPPADASAVVAGTGAAASGSQPVSATGAQSVAVTGLSPATGYAMHYAHRDAAGNVSAMASGDGFTTEAEISTPAVITAGKLRDSTSKPAYPTPAFPSPVSNGLLLAAAAYGSSSSRLSVSGTLSVDGGAATALDASFTSSGNKNNAAFLWRTSPAAGSLVANVSPGGPGSSSMAVLPVNLGGYTVLGNQGSGEGTSSTSPTILNTLSRSLTGSVGIYLLSIQIGTGAVTWPGATQFAREDSGDTNQFSDTEIVLAYRMLDGTSADNVVPSWAVARNYAYRMIEFGPAA